MVRSIWGRALVAACALSVGQAQAQETTVTVTQGATAPVTVTVTKPGAAPTVMTTTGPTTTAKAATAPVTIRSASKKTELAIGAYVGDQPVAWHHGYAVAYRSICQPLCTTTPCTVQMSPGLNQLCTAQPGVVPHYSADVNVPPAGADVALRAYPGGAYVAGVWLSISGALLEVAGTGALVAWATHFAPDGKRPGTSEELAGATLMGGGGALLAAGIPVATVYGREGVASMSPPAKISVGATGLGGTF